MSHPVHRPASPLRGPLSGVSALVVVGLLLGASFRALEPAVREVQRETGADRIAVRQISATLAKAVRELVGSDTHKPCAHQPSGLTVAAATLGRALATWLSAIMPSQRLLRTELLDLPPPAFLA